MQNLAQPIVLKPVFHEMIWGGRRLETELGYTIPDGPIGECWAISAHPHGDCLIAGGSFDGMHLSELWREHRHELFPGADQDRFPLLVKIIDAAADLSVQVHPNDEYATLHEHGSLGKRECWYVLDCDDDATIVIGQRAKSRAELAQMIEEERWNELLNEVPIQPGDFFQIDPGTVHAIKAGTLILEVQQSSDITYRLFDYNRKGADGKTRELHIAQSLDVVDYTHEAPSSGAIQAIEHDGITCLESNESYTVELIRTNGSRIVSHSEPFLCISVIGGAGTICGEPVQLGSHVLIPATIRNIEIEGELKLITCRP
ncbi:class I mannose-6-phosphate isomerase [Collinsella sp. AGMB00827]|uniref:Phosphohexomutase n=1 Tax=Collinsella ureilytica TaxID=2869515 RepID=A0ABS7MJH4_9ACTN|nr:type I phosphomannose isomerase catalytic subunit [Collinsella urealyticum]MBY4797517.1 class I mannose-6-phosphate isomerase [Collinsella urealyticum]